uniref:Cytochrome c oxidase assembly factor 3 mitochondrial coiled-coil domain-containing protein n=1 Tax=Tetraselmis sp. GSL018 TaxID=582737 RepID=A0A061RN71_9CHLO
MPVAVKSRAPNFVVAGALSAFVLGTYWYTMRAVGQDDIQKEIDREAARLAQEESSSVGAVSK